MPDFAYTAIDHLGRRFEGTASAADENTLAQLLRGQERYLVEARRSDDVVDLAQIRILERVTRRDVIFFTSQLATIISTGVNMVEGLADIEDQVTKAPMRRVVLALRRDIESGKSLSTAIERHPSVFGDLYVNIVRAGEATGKLDRVLEDLVVQLEWQEALAARIREVSTYPVLVIGLLVVVSAVLVGFTIPRFQQVYSRLAVQVEMPLPTLVIMGVTSFIRTNWLVLIIAGIAAFMFIRLQAESPTGSVTLARFVLKIPVVGELVRKIALARFAHYFGTLHEAGLEVTPSMTIVERLIGNAYISQQFRRATQRVIAGESLSRALKTVGQFPPVVIQMVALGERTGQMTKALENVRRYYDREVDRTVTRSLTLFGPIMLLMLAGVFVTMALAFYLPLFQLMRAVR